MQNLFNLVSGKSNLNNDKIISVSFQYVSTSPFGYSKKRLYLVITYEKGFQVYDFNNVLSPIEIISQRTKQPIDFCKILDYPSLEYKTTENEINYSKHPLLCLVTTTENFEPTLRFYSLRLLTYTDTFTGFREKIREIKCNSRLFIVVMRSKIYWYNPLTFKRITKFHMFPNGFVALRHRWIAFPSNSLVNNKNFYLLSNQNGLKHIAKKTAKALLSFSEEGGKKIKKYVMGNEYQKNVNVDYSSMPQAGTVEIRDIKSKKLLCHFKAHTLPISAIEFDFSGTLLATASKSGTHVNLYKILPKKSDVDKTFKKNDIILLCKIVRGFTNAIIRSISFSINNKWVNVTSDHGTSHVFNIEEKNMLPKEMRGLQFKNECFLKKEKRKSLDISEGGKKNGEIEPYSVIDVNSVGKIKNMILKSGGQSEKGESSGELDSGSDDYMYLISSIFFSHVSTGRISEKIKPHTIETILTVTNSGKCCVWNIVPLDRVIDCSKKIRIDKIKEFSVIRDKDFEINTNPIKWDQKEEEKEMDDLKIDKLISNVEIECFDFPKYPLWMMGQFKFKTFAGKDLHKKNRITNKVMLGSLNYDLARSILVPSGPPMPAKKGGDSEKEKSMGKDDEQWEMVGEDDYFPEHKTKNIKGVDKRKEKMGLSFSKVKIKENYLMNPKMEKKEKKESKFNVMKYLNFGKKKVKKEKEIEKKIEKEVTVVDIVKEKNIEKTPPPKVEKISMIDPFEKKKDDIYSFLNEKKNIVKKEEKKDDIYSFLNEKKNVVKKVEKKENSFDFLMKQVKNKEKKKEQEKENEIDDDDEMDDSFEIMENKISPKKEKTKFKGKKSSFDKFEEMLSKRKNPTIPKKPKLMYPKLPPKIKPKEDILQSEEEKKKDFLEFDKLSDDDSSFEDDIKNAIKSVEIDKRI